jgi:ubiquinol-cytochrome c reductase cytochrome c1 subunit
MKKAILFFLLMLPTFAFAAGPSIPLMKANVDVNDKASLQSGAKTFVNYCMGCHSMDFMRYQRLATDLEIPEDIVKTTLINGDKKIGETMTIPMQKKESAVWFGVAPPDLTLTARSRGADWLYTYMMTFYLDNSRSVGVNNLVFKDVGMPHVLWELQGWQTPVYKTVTDSAGVAHQVIERLQADPNVSEAQQAEYRRTVRDLVNFMAYAAEPARLQRESLGWKVMLFLALFFIIAYALKKEYWRDVQH